MTRALPPSMIATQELVVPRSMPMIFAMGYASGFVSGAATPPMSAIWGSLPAPSSTGNRDSVRAGHGHHGRAQQLFVEAVALLEQLGHGARLHAGGLDHAHGLVQVGVEGLASGRGDLVQALVAGHPAQFAQGQLDAVAQGAGVA